MIAPSITKGLRIGQLSDLQLRLAHRTAPLNASNVPYRRKNWLVLHVHMDDHAPSVRTATARSTPRCIRTAHFTLGLALGRPCMACGSQPSLMVSLVVHPWLMAYISRSVTGRGTSRVSTDMSLCRRGAGKVGTGVATSPVATSHSRRMGKHTKGLFT